MKNNLAENLEERLKLFEIWGCIRYELQKSVICYSIGKDTNDAVELAKKMYPWWTHDEYGREEFDPNLKNISATEIKIEGYEILVRKREVME